MIRTLKALFEERLAEFADGGDATTALPLAVAALLVEIAKADHEVDERERHAMCAAVAQLCRLPAADVETVLAEADAAVDEAVSLFDFTSVVNQHLERKQKYELLLTLWRIAYADGRLDHYEEYYVRKIADLLHLSPRDFIRAKHEAALPRPP